MNLCHHRQKPQSEGHGDLTAIRQKKRSWKAYISLWMATHSVYFKCEFHDLTGPENPSLGVIVVGAKGGRALGLSTRRRDIQACWQVPAQRQKSPRVLHVPSACRAESIPKGDGDNAHACASPIHHAAGSNSGDHLHGHSEMCCLHPAIPRANVLHLSPQQPWHNPP